MCEKTKVKIQDILKLFMFNQDIVQIYFNFSGPCIATMSTLSQKNNNSNFKCVFGWFHDYLKD